MDWPGQNFPLSSALVFSGEEIDLESVSMASKATRGGLDLSQVPTVRRVTPSLSASVAWEMRRDRRIDFRAFIGAKCGNFWRLTDEQQSPAHRGGLELRRMGLGFPLSP